MNSLLRAIVTLAAIAAMKKAAGPKLTGAALAEWKAEARANRF